MPNPPDKATGTPDPRKNPYERFAGSDLILRDHLAIDRTILANERTFLAYVRTSLALVLTGAGCVRFFVGFWFHVTGFALIGIGCLVAGIGIRRGVVTARNIAAIHRRKRSDARVRN